MMIIGLAFFGCGEQAEEVGNGDGADGGSTGDVTEDGGEHAGGTGGDGGERVAVQGFDFETADLEVGQWIEFGADNLPQTVKISVVGTEMNQGTECYWIQISTADFVGQVLVDAEGLETAMADYEDQFGEFAADPAAYIRENMSDATGMANMFGNEESMSMAIEFVRALRMVKFEQQGMVMAVDLAGVADWLEDMMQDPAFQDQFQQGFAQGFNAEGGQEGLDTIISELDNIDFTFEETEVDVAGDNMRGLEFGIAHPEGSVSVVLTSELPILPLAYAEISGDGENHYVEVRGYGFSGAQDLLPGAPAQTIQAMMFLQGMEQQMGAMGAQQGRGIN
ncbi:MAG: hypothetical protein JXR55_06305 [Candidatus Fermentibacteraceae bacterium]|nr:hypothetical protein [Candidatus Fermentibacteraceae bacterium]